MIDAAAANIHSRFVFIAGLHRTGTSLLASLLGQHSAIAAIAGAPVPEQEGCYLQGAIPHTARHGIPGHFATDPAQHYTEGHALNTMETRDRLWTDWRGWFDCAQPWLLEKSPVNLTRMRLLQALFPLSKFIVVLRHPQIMAAALQKWTDCSEAELTAYALAAYKLAEQDAAFLHSHLFLRYEDLVRNPETCIGALHAFLDIEPQNPRHDLRDGNAEYTAADGLDEARDRMLARWGYGAAGKVVDFRPIVADPLRRIRDGVSAKFSGTGL